MGDAHLTSGNQTPVIAAKAFDKQTTCAVKNQKPNEDLTIKFFLEMKKKQDQKMKNQEKKNRLKSKKKEIRKKKKPMKMMKK